MALSVKIVGLSCFDFILSFLPYTQAPTMQMLASNPPAAPCEDNTHVSKTRRNSEKRAICFTSYFYKIIGFRNWVFLNWIGGRPK